MRPEQQSPLPHNRSLHPTRPRNLAPSTTNMSDTLLNILLSFQPEAPELNTRRDYDQAARTFASEISNISASHWQKGADAPNDALTVWHFTIGLELSLILPGSQPIGQLDSVRLRPAPSHLRPREQAQHPRHSQARRRAMEQAGVVFGDVRSGSDAVCGPRVEEVSQLRRGDCAGPGFGML